MPDTLRNSVGGRASIRRAQTVRRYGSPVAHLVLESGKAFSLFNTPETVTTGGHSRKFGSVDRPGRKPLTQVDSQNLWTVQFTHTLNNDTGFRVATHLAKLQALAALGVPVRFVGMNPGLGGWWDITSLQVNITRFDEHQQPKDADLTWQFTEAVKAPVKIGRAVPPLTRAQIEAIQKVYGTLIGAAASVVNSIEDQFRTDGGPSPTASYQYQIDVAESGRKYHTHKGDTLRGIASVHLGDANRWREIADLNKKVLAPYVSKIMPADWRGTIMFLPAGLTLEIPLTPLPGGTTFWQSQAAMQTAGRRGTFS